MKIFSIFLCGLALLSESKIKKTEEENLAEELADELFKKCDHNKNNLMEHD